MYLKNINKYIFYQKVSKKYKTVFRIFIFYSVKNIFSLLHLRNKGKNIIFFCNRID